MRFLADENFPGTAVKKLLERGHDVIWLRTVAPGVNDREVLRMAAQDGRIILTFDKDFGEISRNTALPASFSVILFRIPMPPPAEIGERLAAIVESRSDWAGNISVVEPGRIRMRKLSDL
jgi:predicted nuclease of predicted toxin-antitoxin system